MKHTRYTLRRQRKYAAGMVIITIVAALGIPGMITAHFAKAQTVTQEATSTPEVVIRPPEPEIAPEPPKPVPKQVTSGSANLPSKEQKQATAIACAHAWEDNRSELEGANVSKNLYLTTCYYDLLAIARHESGFNNEARNISAREQSYGPFQINRNAHPDITVEQATDYVFAVNWTVNHLHAFNYPMERTLAIQAHNGLAYDASGKLRIVYAEAVKATAQKFLEMGL